MAVVNGASYGAKIKNAFDRAVTKVFQSVSKAFDATVLAIGKVFDGVVVALVSATSDPVKLAGLTFLGFLLLDLIFAGNLSFIKFIITTITTLVGVITAVKIEVLVFIAFIVVMLKR